MMRFALFVDAGYFYAAGSEVAYGHSIRRRELRLRDPEHTLQVLTEKASALCDNISILRTYWYDAMPGPHLSADQAELALLDSVKLRLGVLNGQGQQKGVDSLIVTDLAELARNRAITDAVLISGDEDIRIGVQLAQSYGVRVHLLGAGQVSHNTSLGLRHEADTSGTLDSEVFRDFLEYLPQEGSMLDTPPSTSANPNEAYRPPSSLSTRSRTRVQLEPLLNETLENSARRVSVEILGSLDTRGKEQLHAQHQFSRAIPPEYDRRLIAAVSFLQNSRKLTQSELHAVRQTFLAELLSDIENAESPHDND